MVSGLGTPQCRFAKSSIYIFEPTAQCMSEGHRVVKVRACLNPISSLLQSGFGKILHTKV